jgi:hypothetical protein
MFDIFQLNSGIIEHIGGCCFFSDLQPKDIKQKTMGGNVDADILTKQHFPQAHMKEKNNWKLV